MALFIGVAILPSTLNVQQPNPGQVAEYAPLPPDDIEPPDSTGASLGLGTGGGLSTGTPPPPTVKPPDTGPPKIK
ncbi:MAG: hypothetical protein ABIS18_11090, partial [Actinomycetota bacterium]